ncbi:hypothetical protein BZU93_29525, partial [Salmonella enterica subsp. enterica]|nr:hypothetical protein [Salmonella enterica subsp. enterica serovar Enteritidis]
VRRLAATVSDQTISPPSIREALETVLSSATFARSDRARALLRYLVDRQLEGQADRLKGFSIAVDVFGKDADYDPATDAIVRVQAGRLRELLDQYYATEGSADAVRISIPRGSYAPAYARAPEAPTQAVELSQAPERGRTEPRRTLTHYVVRQVRLFWGAFAVLFLMLLFVVWNSLRENMLDVSISANAAPATRMAEAAVSLPHVFLETDDDHASRRLGAVLRTALTGFDTVVYIARNAPATGDAGAQDFAFVVNAGPAPGSANVSLINLRGGEVIASRLVGRDDIAADRIDGAVADIVTSTVPVSGALYSYLEANGLQRGLTRCLLLNDDYYLDQSEVRHAEAYQCFEKLQAAGAFSPVILSEMASLQLEAVTDKYKYPPDASMDGGLQLARRAVQMAPTSPYAHRAYGFLYTRMGMPGEALKWTKKAYELGRYDMNMAAAYGYALIMSGDFANGVKIMKHAADISSVRPSWWEYTLFLGGYMIDDKALVAETSASLTATRRPHYVAARLLAAAQAGNKGAVEQLRAELVDKHKAFAANPRRFY